MPLINASTVYACLCFLFNTFADFLDVWVKKIKYLIGDVLLQQHQLSLFAILTIIGDSVIVVHGIAVDVTILEASSVSAQNARK